MPKRVSVSDSTSKTKEELYQRRTRSQPKPRPVVEDNSIKDLPPPVPETAASQDSSTSPPQDSQTYTTVSGRTLKPPNRLHV